MAFLTGMLDMVGITLWWDYNERGCYGVRVWREPFGPGQGAGYNYHATVGKFYATFAYERCNAPLTGGWPVYEDGRAASRVIESDVGGPGAQQSNVSGTPSHLT